MSGNDDTIELGTNATLAAGLALLAVAAVGGGGLVASLEGAQVGYFLSDGSAGWTIGSSVGGGVLGGGSGALIGAAVTGGGGAYGFGALSGLAVGGPVGAVIGAGAGAA